MAGLEAGETETVPAIVLGPEQRGEHLALRFTGSFEVPGDDVYVFCLRSDDGSDLWIDGVRVIDNDGLHGSLEKQGNLALAEGVHEIQVRWFNKTGGADLSIECGPLGGELVPLEELR